MDIKTHMMTSPLGGPPGCTPAGPGS
ncbi:hypothetical protein Taro_007413 [Colocasia esculenta]|uniref:Uncharacterized protein n=1 Tax=Colocasia esculenta TaxID=4460 RepID=A0A843U3S6_COLES|nr:hypothetical protein [Colocasia esculenta]